MKFRLLQLALACCLLPTLASAQDNPSSRRLPDLPAPAAASSPIAPASAVPNRRPPPRPRGVAETGTGAAAPGDLAPERPVAPQISIPFGKKAPAPSFREERLVDRGGAASAGGVDDRAARCDAQISAQLRADCRAKLPSVPKTPAPD